MTGLDEMAVESRATAPPVGRRRVPRGAVVAAVCAAISVVSLPLPATLAFDPWAWLVWGREIGHLDLDTTGGPSWKPLPVLVTTVLGAAGDLAPTLWLVVARTAGLLALVVTYRLAARYAGPAAGVVAAGLLLLTPDGGPRFLRLVVEGHSAPVTAALCLWAVDRHLEGRHAQALVLATALSLERPEAWPFLLLYAVWMWRHEPARRPLVALALGVVPVLWFGADWWGSGDLWHGAGAAQVESSGLVDRLALVWERTARVVVTPAWVAAAAALVTAWRRRERTAARARCGRRGVAAAGRRHERDPGVRRPQPLPAARGGGAVRAGRRGPGPHRGRRARGAPPGSPVVAAIAAVSLPFVVTRVSSFGTVVDGVTSRAELERQLDLVVERAGGPEAVLACGRVVVRQSDVPRVAMAWKLDVPLDRVERRARRPARGGLRAVRAGRGRPAGGPAARRGHPARAVDRVGRLRHRMQPFLPGS